MLVLHDAILGTDNEYVESSQVPRFSFGHYISLCCASVDARDKVTNAHIEKHPMIIIQVCAKRSDSIESLLGYGVLHIPTTHGTHDIEVPTCRPVCSEETPEPLFRLKDYYLGSTVDEMQIRNMLEPSMKQKVKTESSGSVRIRLQSISTELFTSFPATDNHGTMPILKESVDEVLSRVRRNKRETSLYDSLETLQESKNGEKLIVSRKTKEVLERVRARKDARRYA